MISSWLVGQGGCWYYSDSSLPNITSWTLQRKYTDWVLAYKWGGLAVGDGSASWATNRSEETMVLVRDFGEW
jgi:hypothetical protein